MDPLCVLFSKLTENIRQLDTAFGRHERVLAYLYSLLSFYLLWFVSGSDKPVFFTVFIIFRLPGSCCQVTGTRPLTRSFSPGYSPYSSTVSQPQERHSLHSKILGSLSPSVRDTPRTRQLSLNHRNATHYIRKY